MIKLNFFFSSDESTSTSSSSSSCEDESDATKSPICDAKTQKHDKRDAKTQKRDKRDAKMKKRKNEEKLSTTKRAWTGSRDSGKHSFSSSPSGFIITISNTVDGA